jgi:HAMP domain-containing protein
MPIRIPIRVKITLPYLFLVLVFSISVAFLASKIILETVDERFSNQLYEAGQIAAEGMAREEVRMLATLRLLSNLKDVPEALQSGEAELLRELTLGAVINQQEEAVEFLNADLDLVLSMHHKQGGQIEEYDFLQGGADFASWEVVSQAARGRADASGDKFAGLVRISWGDFLYISGPVYNAAGEQVGVILVGRTVATLTRKLREATLSQVSFYSFAGEPIASTFPDPTRLDAKTVDLVIDNQASTSYRRNFDTIRLHYGEILGPWKVRGSQDLGVMGVALVKNTLVNASLPTRLQITALVALTVFIILMIGINVAAVITRPLLNLVSASRLVAQGNLDVQVSPASSDEIADLAESFNLMVRSLNQTKLELLRTYDETLISWSKALELRDHDTEGHSQRVTELTIELATKCGFTDEELSHIRRGAILHDIGKIGIPDSILQKKGPLTPAEWEVMRMHPQYAYEMLKNIDFLAPSIDIPYCHHEKWDGSGYPRGLKGTEIPVAARLFAIVDMWEALNSDRCYRKAMDPEEAMTLVRAGRGSHFDAELLDLFLQHLGHLPETARTAAAAAAAFAVSADD